MKSDNDTEQVANYPDNRINPAAHNCEYLQGKGVPCYICNPHLNKIVPAALQRIKEIEDQVNNWNGCPVCGDNSVVLLKAFNVMREIAIKNHPQGHMDPGFCPWGASPDQCIDTHFEERMSK